ncbi:glycosyltransferase family 2 protein [Vibrio splendidus]|uniref:Glycosyltransferase 2-like domain-containing protein n=1 Tax=Vibrio splendidus TaxID=29497 RepID=A0A837NV67_VIBSP|nr:glycosyltransferase family 2 protein [Vibrio splendidus]KPL93150.1 hypothetical protein AN168_17665 [Vibrio splendidus]
MKISVFTPTYNRSESLARLYCSLKNQTYKNFTWVIVDDGSKDNTKQLVSEWISENLLDIAYYHQPNSGKQRAYNVGIEQSKGDLFICIDSDDIYLEHAFERIVNVWSGIQKKNEYIAISYLSKTFGQKLIGTKFPNDVTDEYHFNMHNYYNVKGDKGMAFDLKKLKRFVFPVFPNEKFMTEALLYNRMSLKYKTRYINEELEVKEYMNDGLSSKYLSLLINNPCSSALYYKEFKYHNLNLKLNLKSNIYEMRYNFHSKKPWYKIILNDVNIYKILSFPISFTLYLKDKKNAIK